MSTFHDEVDLDEFEYDEETETFTYPCPCGDVFFITRAELLDGDDVARCPSCSLILRVIYRMEDLMSEESAAETVSSSALQKTTST
eukprot:m.192110 g.192110  ORF g.192110 m.192110 type:complete len:86 (+) comp17582_c0_seq6:2824-3081(+)